MKKNHSILILIFTFGVATGVIGTYLAISQNESPYLSKPGRLGDVVAAICVMGTYKFDNMPPEIWRKHIGANPNSATSWEEVFNEHTDFFRTEYSEKDKTNKVSLVWRRARNFSWDTKTQKEISQVELDDPILWPKDKKEKEITRKPLKAEETTALIEIANQMQTQAIARRAELRWWVPVVFGLIGILVGAFANRIIVTPTRLIQPTQKAARLIRDVSSMKVNSDGKE